MFGQRFRLKADAIATTDGPDKRIAVQVPAGAQIVVLDHIQTSVPLDSSFQVNVEWNGKVVSMFLVDIHEKGERNPPGSKGRAVSDR
jgi:hypothetical protein